MWAIVEAQPMPRKVRKFAKNAQSMTEYEWRTVRDEVRTLFANKDKELMEILAGIQTIEQKLNIKREVDPPRQKRRTS